MVTGCPSGDRARGAVELRAVASGDLPTLYRMQCEAAGNGMAVSRPRTREGFDAHWREVLEKTDAMARVILLDGEVVGSISVFEMDGEDAVGYWVGEAHWGKGIASAALRLLLAEVRTRPLVARVARSNAGSVRVLEKYGFRVEGTRMSEETERFPACEEVLLRMV